MFTMKFAMYEKSDRRQQQQMLDTNAISLYPLTSSISLIILL